MNMPVRTNTTVSSFIGRSAANNEVPTSRMHAFAANAHTPSKGNMRWFVRLLLHPSNNVNIKDVCARLITSRAWPAETH